MIKTVINIEDIKSVVTAAQNLQDAGKGDDAKRVLVDLANEIKKELEK